MEEMVLVNQTAGKVECDFESVKQRLLDKLDEYRGAVFTEDSKTVAKAIVANLRKEKKGFSDRIKVVKTAYMAPYMDFETKAKELLSLYDQPINLIDGQVKEFEEKRIQEKKERIHILYEDNAGEVASYIPLEKIYNPKWENATMKEKAIAQEIADLAYSTKSAIDTIKMMKSEAEEKALNLYKTNLSLPDAITYINNYERQKAEILVREQERQRQEEQDRIRREEREKIEAEHRAQAALRQAEEEKQRALEQAEIEKQQAVEQAKEEATEALIPELTGEANLYEYRMELTEDAKEKLEMYLDSVGIEWELI